MQYKTNFKYIIIAHIVGIVLLLVLLVAGVNDNGIIKGLVIGFGFSLLLQVLLYVIKPTMFNAKIKKYPHQH